MGTPKQQPPKATPEVRPVVLLDFDCERTLRRLAHYERWAQEWMHTPGDPLRLPAQLLLKWIPVARGHLEQGSLAVQPLLMVERYFGWAVWMQAVAHAGKFQGKPKPRGALRPALDLVVAKQSTIHWLKAMSAVVPLLTQPGEAGKAFIQARVLSYLDADGTRRTIGSAAFQSALSAAKGRQQIRKS